MTPAWHREFRALFQSKGAVKTSFLRRWRSRYEGDGGQQRTWRPVRARHALTSRLGAHSSKGQRTWLDSFFRSMLAQALHPVYWASRRTAPDSARGHVGYPFIQIRSRVRRDSDRDSDGSLKTLSVAQCEEGFRALVDAFEWMPLCGFSSMDRRSMDRRW